MFCWCYYAHITRIARSPPLGPVGLVPERERGGGEGGRERERMEEEARKHAKKTAAWQNDRFSGFIQAGGSREDVGFGMEMEENWSNQVLMCSGLQTFLALLH